MTEEPSVNHSPARMELTFISQQAPYNTNQAQRCLDMVLAAAVFDQSVNYLFLGDGCYQLLVDQEGDRIERKTLAKGLQALDLYGVEEVLVSADELARRGLTTAELCVPCKALNAQEIKRLIERSDAVFTL